MSTKNNAEELRLRGKQLEALNRAAMAIASELSLDKVLQQIVEATRELVGAEYAALGVPNKDGLLETFIYSGLTPEAAAHIPHLPVGLGLLGAIIREKQSIRLPSIADDPRSSGFPVGHPAMIPFLGVPVMAGEVMLGNLYLTNKTGAEAFTEADQELVEMLAAHAAVAIQNARLYEQVGRLAVLEERTRIGMDLHDGIIQSIYAVGLTLESARLALNEDAGGVDELLAVAITGMNDAIKDIRNFILDLRPQRFDGDLRAGIAKLAREFQANTMVEVHLDMPNDLARNLPLTAARTMFLTTQEALANVARHAKAQHVTISLVRETLSFQFTIEDDGQGFDATTQSRTVGHGLSNMQARAEALRGSLKLESKPGRGTMIKLTLPYR